MFPTSACPKGSGPRGLRPNGSGDELLDVSPKGLRPSGSGGELLDVSASSLPELLEVLVQVMCDTAQLLDLVLKGVNVAKGFGVGLHDLLSIEAVSIIQLALGLIDLAGQEGLHLLRVALLHKLRQVIQS